MYLVSKPIQLYPRMPSTSTIPNSRILTASSRRFSDPKHTTTASSMGSQSPRTKRTRRKGWLRMGTGKLLSWKLLSWKLLSWKLLSWKLLS